MQLIVKKRKGISGLLVGLLAAVVSVGLATGILRALKFEQYPYSGALVYILVVLVIASQYGLLPGFAASLLGFLCLNYFFIPPYHTFDIESPAGVVAVISFLIAAAVTSQIAARARRQTEKAEIRQQETEILNELNVAVLGEVQAQDMLARVVQQVAGSVQAEAASLYLPEIAESNQGRGQQLKIGATYNQKDLLKNLFDPKLIEQTFLKKEATFVQLPNNSTPPLTWLAAYLPLLRAGESLGVMALLIADNAPGNKFRLDYWTRFTNPPRPGPQMQNWLAIVANQAALAVYHARLIAQTAQLASLEEADRLKSALLALVSHELRTPLTSIKTAVAGLTDEAINLEPEEQREYLGVIDQEADRLGRLISNMLNLSRIEGGKLKPEKGLYYLPEIVTKTLGRLSRNVLIAEHPLRTRFEEDLPLAPVDYLQIEQVLVNLIENAAKYSSPNSPITIEVCQALKPAPKLTGAELAKAKEEENSKRLNGVIVKVIDEGYGIPEGEIGRVFDKFYQVDMLASNKGIGGNPGGSGLGLAVCKGIVEAHGGQIWADSHPGKGSSFAFWLPLERNQRKQD